MLVHQRVQCFLLVTVLRAVYSPMRLWPLPNMRSHLRRQWSCHGAMAEGTWALDLTCRLLQFWFKDVLTWFLIAIGSDHADLDLHCFHLPVLGTAAGITSLCWMLIGGGFTMRSFRPLDLRRWFLMATCLLIHHDWGIYWNYAFHVFWYPSRHIQGTAILEIYGNPTIAVKECNSRGCSFKDLSGLY